MLTRSILHTLVWTLFFLLPLTTYAQFEQKIVLDDRELFDFFGIRVEIDGDRALIAAPGDDGVVPDAGVVYVYERQMIGTWMQVASLSADDGEAHQGFGLALALEGETALVGSYFNDEMGTNWAFCRGQPISSNGNLTGPGWKAKTSRE